MDTDRRQQDTQEQEEWESEYAAWLEELETLSLLGKNLDESSNERTQ